MLDMVVNVGKARADSPFIPGALELARRERAFVTGLQVVAVYPSLLGQAEVAALIAAEERDARMRQEWWLELCRKAGVEGAWEVLRGIYVTSLAKRSQLADLLVCELPVRAPEAPAGFDELTRVLFADTSPMLLVPDTWTGTLSAQRVLIAWNGSGEAARAAKAALPLLEHATAVRVLDGTRVALPGIGPPPPPLREWLERHGIRAQWQHFEAERDTGRALLAEARGMQADLLVMGAWGRSRMSELILGGATRWMLDHASLPLLLTH
ncbi:universal stress protein [Frateuria defendens]|uniref:universal stress protein n=1 Tax=Frateuria defendens TaxID=2219559 RepID=UPI00066FD514|nr:universal stress protein [Frateuria defendens]